MKKGEATRQKLLEAAREELIANDGSLEVAKVAQRVEVSVGLIYRYFLSRAGLIAAVVEDFYDKHDSYVMEKNPAPGLGWAAREQIRIQREVEFSYHDPLAAIVLAKLKREPEVAAIEAQHIIDYIDQGKKNVQKGQQKGEIPPDLDAGMVSAILLGGIREAISQALMQKKRPAQQKVTQELCRFMLAGIRYQNGETK